MTLARGIAKGIGAGVASAVTRGQASGGGSSYDTDAQDYFTRAEGLGGSFNLTSINATYTEAYVKTAISDFVAGCKTDSIWTKLTEVYLLSGVTFSGLMAKLKYIATTTLTNANFVTGDYLAAGTGAGLKGNGSTKSINTGVTSADIDEVQDAFGIYATEAATTGAFGTHGYSNLSTVFEIYSRYNSVNQFGFAKGINSFAMVGPSGVGTGFYLGASTGTASANRFGMLNGGSAITAGAGAVSTTGGTDALRLFARNTVADTHTDQRLAFAFVGLNAMTVAECQSLSARVNTLMTALGANVY